MDPVTETKVVNADKDEEQSEEKSLLPNKSVDGTAAATSSDHETALEEDEATNKSPRRSAATSGDKEESKSATKKQPKRRSKRSRVTMPRNWNPSKVLYRSAGK